MGQVGFIHIAVTLGKVLFLNQRNFFLGFRQETIDRTILYGDKVIISSILTSRRCRRPSRKTLRIRADTIFECWKEILLVDLVHGIYLWSHDTQVSTLE